MTFSQYFLFLVFAYFYYYLLFPNRICSISCFMLCGWHFPNIFHLSSLLTFISIYYSQIESVPLAVLCSVDGIFPIFFYLSLLTFISIYCVRKRSLTKKPLIIWLIYDVKNIEWSSVCFWRNLKKKKKLIVLKKQAENCTEGSSTVSLSTNRYFLNWRYTYSTAFNQ